MARSLYQEARDALKTAIDSRDEHAPTEIADMLCVGRATVSNWVGSGALPFQEKRLKGGRLIPKGPNQRRLMGRQFIKAQTLHDRFQWVTPF
jgi:transposase